MVGDVPTGAHVGGWQSVSVVKTIIAGSVGVKSITAWWELEDRDFHFEKEDEEHENPRMCVCY